MTNKEIITGFSVLRKELNIEKKKCKIGANFEGITIHINELSKLIKLFRKGKINNLADFQKYSKWNYPTYFVMTYNTNINGISLRDLREQHNNSFNDIVRVKTLHEFCGLYL